MPTASKRSRRKPEKLLPHEPARLGHGRVPLRHAQPHEARQSPPASYVYDPLDVRPAELEREPIKNEVTDQRYALNLFGNGLVFHSDPFPEAVEITGYLKLVAWIALDVPDTDFAVKVYEIKPDGTSIALADDLKRARYRKSLRQEKLVKPGAIERYEFDSFNFFSRRLEKGSRLRLVFSSPNSIYLEKNYNSGGEVAAESRNDARTAHVALYQDAEHASYLEDPDRPRVARQTFDVVDSRRHGVRRHRAARRAEPTWELPAIASLPSATWPMRPQKMWWTPRASRWRRASSTC